ncbi:MAG: tol-pal system protein YbgF [Pseudomonadota bacterium]
MRNVLLLWFVIGIIGCASTQSAESTKLHQRLERMAQARAADQRRMEDLNNRLFLLEDEVDTCRVTRQSTGKEPRLPVIRIKPVESAESEEEFPAKQSAVAQNEAFSGSKGSYAEDLRVPATGTGSSVVANEEVVYGGDAAKEGTKRPVLRLDESGDNLAPSEFPSESGLPMVKEKLPVVPLAKLDSDVNAPSSYATAMEEYKAGRHSEAAEAFKKFVQMFPTHSYADNATYWLGECHYDMKKYQEALKLFRQLLEKYPKGNKVPDALLKMGFSYLKMNDPKNARVVLAQLVEIYPKSEVARLASTTLVRLR